MHTKTNNSLLNAVLGFLTLTIQSYLILYMYIYIEKKLRGPTIINRYDFVHVHTDRISQLLL